MAALSFTLEAFPRSIVLPASPAEEDPLRHLVSKVRDGDARAFHELYRRTRDDVYGVLFRLVGNSPDLDDLVQEAYIQLLRALRGFRGDAATRTFIFRVCANVGLMHLRRGRRRPEELTDAPPEHPTSEAHDPERAAQVRQASQVLDRALAELSDDKRVVFVYHELMGLLPEEIAEALDIPKNTVRSRLSRAREEFAGVVARLLPQQAPAAQGGRP